jgi:hypothetical protein
MSKARPKYPTDLYGTIYIYDIQKAVVICLIIPTTFPFDAGSRVDKYNSGNISTIWQNKTHFYTILSTNLYDKS